MFEKIFGIFRKKKKADISQEIPGEMDEDMFDIGGAEMGDDLDADTISLETGMSDGGFSDSSGGMEDSSPELGAGVGMTEPPLEDEFGLGSEGDEDDILGIAAEDDFGVEVTDGPPISPPPDVEAYVPPKSKREIKGVLTIAAVAVVGLIVGFVAMSKPVKEQVKRITSSEPTAMEQIVQLKSENAGIEERLAPYREVGTIDEIMAAKDELKKRENISKDVEAINAKIADRTSVEERIEALTVQLAQIRSDLAIQLGSLANVQKGVKQTEARQNYLASSTHKNLERIEQARIKSDLLKSRLELERIKRAEAEAFLSRDVQAGIERTALETLSSL